MDTKQLKFDRTFVVEFTIVVVGVFVALAAETWWSEREERQFEREIREDMIVEFEANIRILDADIAENEEARNRIGMLDSLDDDALLAIDDSKISEHLVPYLQWAGFDPEIGSIQAFIENGNVGAISDRQLRLLLSRWSGLLVKNRRINLQAVDFQHIAVQPFVARANSDHVWSNSERRELRALLSHLLALQGFVLINQRELREAATDILTFLRDEH